MIRKRNKLAVCVLLIGLMIEGGKSEFTSVVQTEKGPVRGEILKTVLNSVQYGSFRAIPYAEPPVGNLRFKPPVEKESWAYILNATSTANMCIQYDRDSSSPTGSEDCLYLNVFTPHTNFNGALSKPVMFWIHGGGYNMGSSDEAFYGPDFILEKDVILVSINYRLGPLGFLNLNHEGATGNYGLKDQVLALKWVQKNIAKFGGDPKKVTIFGQSAGSVAVDYHVLSDMSKGLFKQSISMSGSPLCVYWGFQGSGEAEKHAFQLGSMLGTKTLNKDKLIKALLNATAEDIINKAHGIPLMPFRPTIESTYVAVNEEKFLTECAIKKYTSGNFNKGPHMMGFTPDETLMFAGSVANLLDMVKHSLESIKNATLPINIPFLKEITSWTSEAILNLSEDTVYRLVEETSDFFFAAGIDSKQKLMRFRNHYPIYYYRFAYNSNYSIHKSIGVNLEGVGHADDLSQIFYMPKLKVPLNDPEVALMREKMVRLWTNFAKYGNPTPEGIRDRLLGVSWPNSGIFGRHLEIGKVLTVGFRPIDISVRGYEIITLSPILNECSKNAL